MTINRCQAYDEQVNRRNDSIAAYRMCPPAQASTVHVFPLFDMFEEIRPQVLCSMDLEKRGGNNTIPPKGTWPHQPSAKFFNHMTRAMYMPLSQRCADLK